MDQSGMTGWDEECKTPRNVQNQIPAMLVCPPAPRKKPADGKRLDQQPRRGEYFNPPDLDSLFNVLSRKGTFS
ncbi:hypothetical protein QN277_023386 [Acacia crassicarpa]|nr:hypothetical protein QN277_023386 [Acacia crassicarpa]